MCSSGMPNVSRRNRLLFSELVVTKTSAPFILAIHTAICPVLPAAEWMRIFSP